MPLSVSSLKKSPVMMAIPYESAGTRKDVLRIHIAIHEVASTLEEITAVV